MISKETAKKIKNNICVIMVVIAVVLAAALIAVVNPLYKKSEDMGSSAGGAAGRLCGNVVGSIEGLTEGHAAGVADGTAEALEAKDTEAYIGGRVREKKVLEVLDVNMKQNNVATYEGGNLTVLQILECNATYSVDLSKAEIKIDGDNVNVYIPAPEFTTYNEKTNVIDTYEKKKNAGSTQNGIKGAINSDEEIKKKVNDVLHTDTSLTQRAESAALNQVKIFVNNILVDKDKTVNVSFKEESEYAGN